MTPQDMITRGERARHILDMPEFKAIMNDVQMDVFHQFRKTNIPDVETRESLHQVIFALDLLTVKLTKYVSDATVELNKRQVE